MGKAARLKREREAAADAGPKAIRPTPLDELRNRIALVRCTDLRTVSVEDLVELLKPVFKGWIVRAPVFPPGTSIFRGRRLSTRPRTLAEVSYPAPKATPQGRANRRGSPVFYGSAGREPIYFELALGAGDRVAIVQHKTTAKLLANRIGYTPDTFERLQAKREVPDYGSLNLEAYTRRDSLVNDFLSEVFCEQHDSDGDWRYNLSVAIAEKLIPDDFFAGLIYPTVPMWGNADNFALKPSFVTTSLTPVYAEYVEVTEVHDTSFAINALDEARSFGSDGTIKWLGHPAQWTLSAGEGVICEAVEGRWVAHNLRGEIVEPD
jgi:hypothetical protein